jgi:hypothetical protein
MSPAPLFNSFRAFPLPDAGAATIYFSSGGGGLRAIFTAANVKDLRTKDAHWLFTYFVFWL